MATEKKLADANMLDAIKSVDKAAERLLASTQYGGRVSPESANDLSKARELIERTRNRERSK